jgi:hypothetical protein
MFSRIWKLYVEAIKPGTFEEERFDSGENLAICIDCLS